MSDIEKQPVYTPDDLAGFEAATQLGEAGAYPFTRGIHPDMYRGPAPRGGWP
jgi:methylmalonyl-CoA mutase N-terminal domain/subunit